MRILGRDQLGIFGSEDLAKTCRIPIFSKMGLLLTLPNCVNNGAKRIFPTTGPKMYGQGILLVSLPMRIFGYW